MRKFQTLLIVLMFALAGSIAAISCSLPSSSDDDDDDNACESACRLAYSNNAEGLATCIAACDTTADDDDDTTGDDDDDTAPPANKEEAVVQAVEGTVSSMVGGFIRKSAAKLGAQQAQCTELDSCPGHDLCVETVAGVNTTVHTYMPGTPFDCTYEDVTYTIDSYDFNIETIVNTGAMTTDITYTGGVSVSGAGATTLGAAAITYNNVSISYSMTTSTLLSFSMDVSWDALYDNTGVINVTASMTTDSPITIEGIVTEDSSEIGTFSLVDGAYTWTWQ